tara:strand:+ start:152 stop:862 length:711 start_codon:yes stop_codon:yes gene_type:complete
MIINNDLIKKSIGWSAKSWFFPLKKVLDSHSFPNKKRVLELGAGGYSAISLLFLNKDSKLHITAYNESDLDKVKLLVDSVRDIKNFKNNIKIFSMSAQNIVGKYDIIIMKSVLGGIFRLNNSKKQDADELLKYIADNHLKENGTLISMDNGKTRLESIFSNFGARKNSWRYFLISDFQSATKQYSFGLLSNFSFATRYKNIGHILDSSVFIIDKLIYKIFNIKNPSIIISIYKKNS